MSAYVHQQALSIIKAHYIDFGPTFACEKLTELHDFHFPVDPEKLYVLRQRLFASAVPLARMAPRAWHQRCRQCIILECARIGGKQPGVPHRL